MEQNVKLKTDLALPESYPDLSKYFILNILHVLYVALQLIHLIQWGNTDFIQNIVSSYLLHISFDYYIFQSIDLFRTFDLICNIVSTVHWNVLCIHVNFNCFSLFFSGRQFFGGPGTSGAFRCRKKALKKQNQLHHNQIFHHYHCHQHQEKKLIIKVF